MDKAPFSEIWQRIVSHAGETIKTTRGLPFTYEIRRDTFYPSRTNYQIAKSDFRKVYALVPLPGPGSISDLVRGPSYVWAVLHDRRISKGQW